MILALPLGMLDLPEWFFVAIYGIVWMLALVLPVLLVASRKDWQGSLVVAYMFQAAFSVAQAGLGLLMILGRNI